jgi:hypothetical protein
MRLLTPLLLLTLALAGFIAARSLTPRGGAHPLQTCSETCGLASTSSLSRHDVGGQPMKRTIFLDVAAFSKRLERMKEDVR